MSGALVIMYDLCQVKPYHKRNSGDEQLYPTIVAPRLIAPTMMCCQAEVTGRKRRTNLLVVFPTKARNALKSLLARTHKKKKEAPPCQSPIEAVNKEGAPPPLLVIKGVETNPEEVNKSENIHR